MAPVKPTATPALPAISSLPTLSDAELRSTLDLLFEPSPGLHALALPTMRAGPFASYDDLLAALRAQLLDLAAAADDDSDDSADSDDSPRRRLHAILGSHPRLGGSAAAAGEARLSTLSAEEQRHLRAEAEWLAELNREYEARFPGLRFVTWVNGRGRDEIVAEMRRRIGRGDLREEERETVHVGCFFLLFFCHVSPPSFPPPILLYSFILTSGSSVD